ncbi:MAG: DUF4266 domain-containing protein [Polyangiaceae bacterium]|nr:DUF4266 domain-containing protein [Polyangiaceae bacterium]
MAEANVLHRYRTFAWSAAALIAVLTSGCATVRPEQRAALADPAMQFEAEGGEDESLQHALENREGAWGGGSVKGGGCGCN